MLLLTALALQLIPAASVAVAIGSFLAYLHFARRTETHAARDEAMALASTRAEVIADLRLRVSELEGQLASARAQRADALRAVSRTRRHFGGAVSGVLVDLSDDPPDVETALVRILRLLEDER
jgi:hypothetical protein